MSETPYVIVGNGVAAVNAVEAIRAHDADTPILQLCEEDTPFYSRPGLHYLILGRVKLRDIWARPEDFCEKHGVELHMGKRVTEVRPKERVVVTSDGERHQYRALLLATGARPRLLKWVDRSVRGMVILHNLRDAVEITQVLSEAKRAVVVGGGLTSGELVESCRHYGLETTFIMWEDRFLANQLNRTEAELVHDMMRASGVTVRPNEEVAEALSKGGRVTGVITKSGDEVPCELLGCAVGVLQNRELAARAGARVDRGVIVDEGMRTGVADVYAAGDAVQLETDGQVQEPQMLWYVAADMGKVAGANMAGGDESYRPRVPLNVSKFCETSVCAVGEVKPGAEGVESVIARSDTRSARLITRDGRLVGACFVGEVKLGTTARGLIARGARLAELPPDHPIRKVAESAVPCES